MSHSEFIIHRKKKGEVQSVDLRRETTSLTSAGTSVELVAGRGKPLEFARAITGNNDLLADDVRIEKLDVIFKSTPH